jgi:hypothetical protein
MTSNRLIATAPYLEFAVDLARRIRCKASTILSRYCPALVQSILCKPIFGEGPHDDRGLNTVPSHRVVEPANIAERMRDLIWPDILIDRPIDEIVNDTLDEIGEKRWAKSPNLCGAANDARVTRTSS